MTPVSTRHRQGVTDRALPAVVAAAGLQHDEPAGGHESDLPGRGGRAIPVDRAVELVSAHLHHLL